jgi:hypothetical protein
MELKPTTGKDTLRFEKVMLLILGLCLVVLLGMQVFRFF